MSYNGKGIIIDIGFTSDIDKMIQTIESQIKNVDFDKVIGISDAFKKQYEEAIQYLEKLKQEAAKVTGGFDLSQLGDYLNKINSLSTQLSKAFSQLNNALPADIGKKAGLDNTIALLDNLSGSAENAEVGLDALAQHTQEDARIIGTSISKMVNDFKLYEKSRRRLQNAETTGGFGNTIKRDKEAVGLLIKYWNLAEKSINEYYSATSSSEQAAAIDKYTASLEKANGAANMFFKTTENANNANIKIVGLSNSSVNEIKKQIDRAYGDILSEIQDRQGEIDTMLKKQGVDVYDLFVKQTKYAGTDNTISVDMVLAPKTSTNFKDEVLAVIEKVNKAVETHPVIVDVQLASSYQSRKNQVNIKEIQDQIKELEKQAAATTDESLKTELTTVGENLAHLIDRMNRQIDNAMNFTVQIVTEKAERELKTFVESTREELKNLQSEENFKLIERLLQLIDSIATGLNQLAVPLSNLTSEAFDNNIKSKSEMLETILTQLTSINPLLDAFAKGIKKLDDEKIQKNLESLTTKATAVIKEATDLINPLLPEDKAGEITITIQNKAEILQSIAEVRNAVRGIFDPIIIDQWEQRFLEALATIETKCGSIFNPKVDKSAINVLSLFADDITFSDQMMRSTPNNQYYNTSIGETSAIANELAILQKRIKRLESKKTRLQYKREQLEKDNVNGQNTDAINQLTQAIQEIPQSIELLNQKYAMKLQDREGLPMVNKEHGGAVLTDGRVYGLSSTDRDNATRYANPAYYEKMLGITIDEILAMVHSHAGDTLWTPSKTDLAGIIEDKVPYQVTIAEKEIAVANREAFIDFLSKSNLLVKETDGDKETINAQASIEKLDQAISKFVASYDYDSDKEYEQFAKPYYEYIQSLNDKGIDVADQTFNLQSRYALEKILKDNYQTPLNDLFKVMSHEEFNLTDPLGLRGKVSSEQSGNILLNSLQKIVDGASDGNGETLSEINNSVKEIIQILTTNSSFMNGADSIAVQRAQIKAQMEAIQREIDLYEGGSDKAKRESVRNKSKTTQAVSEIKQEATDTIFDQIKKEIAETSFNLRTKAGKANLETYAQKIMNANLEAKAQGLNSTDVKEIVDDPKLAQKLEERIKQLVLQKVQQLQEKTNAVVEKMTTTSASKSTEPIIDESEMEEFEAESYEEISKYFSNLLKDIIKDPEAKFTNLTAKGNNKLATLTQRDLEALSQHIDSAKLNPAITKKYKALIADAKRLRDEALQRVFDGQALPPSLFRGKNDVLKIMDAVNDPISDELSYSERNEIKRVRNLKRNEVSTLMALRDSFQKTPTDESILEEINRVSKESTVLDNDFKKAIRTYYNYKRINQEISKIIAEEQEAAKNENAKPAKPKKKMFVTMKKGQYEKWWKQNHKYEEKTQNFNTHFEQLLKDNPDFVEKSEKDDNKVQYKIRIAVDKEEWEKFLAELKKPKDVPVETKPSEDELRKAHVVSAFTNLSSKDQKGSPKGELLTQKQQNELSKIVNDKENPNQKIAQELIKLHNKFTVKREYEIVEQFRDAVEKLNMRGKNSLKAVLQKKLQAAFNPPKPATKEELADLVANANLYKTIKEKFGNKLIDDISKERLQYYADDENSTYHEVAKQIITAYNDFLSKPDLKSVPEIKQLVSGSNLNDNLKQQIVTYLNSILEATGYKGDHLSELKAKLAQLAAEDARLANLQSGSLNTNIISQNTQAIVNTKQSSNALETESKSTHQVATSVEEAAKQKEAFASANEQVAASAKESASQINAEAQAVVNLIDSLGKLPQTKNPLLEQLENVTKDSEKLKSLGTVIKGETNKPKGTLEDAQQLLTKNGANIRSKVNDYIAKRLGVVLPEQVETASKQAQEALNKTWANYDVVKDLMQNNAMEESIAKEYANAFVDTYKNAITKGLNISLSDEQKQFLAPMMGQIPKNSSEFLITGMKATKNGLIDITALVKTANGEYQKLLLTYEQLDKKSSILVKDIKTGAEASKAFNAEVQAANQLNVSTKDIDQIGNVTPETESWDELCKLAEKFGLKVKDIEKIIRNVDREGYESFQFFTADGSRTTLGINSETKLWEKNAVVTKSDYMNEFDKLVETLSKSSQMALKGDESAAVKFAETLARIRDIWKQLLVYRDKGLLTDKDLQTKNDLFGGKVGFIGNMLGNLDTKNTTTEYQNFVAELRTSFSEIRGDLDLTSLINSDSTAFDTLIQKIAQLIINMTKLNEVKERALTSSQIDKWISKMSDFLRKNSSMPREYQNQIRSLVGQMRKLQEQYGNSIPKEMFDPLMQQYTAVESKMKELGYTGRNMWDKMKTAMKNSILQVTRMYLSWYRLIAYIRQGVQEVTNLDTALTKMSYTMNISNTQLQNMGKEMVSMAKNLATSVDNISQIYQIYANLQTTQEELEKTARPTAILANLSGVDASTAADQLQGVLNQFKLTADDANHIVDVYDKISASIKVDYSKGIAGMADAVKNVGNFANEAGMSFEQLSAIVGRVMQQTRMEGGQIGVSLKTIMTRISKANKLADDGEVDNKTLSQASQALKRWADIDVYTPSGEFREFDVIMTELAEKWNELSDAEQANISFAIAATRQTAVLKAILQNWTGAMDLATEAVNANGNALANQEKYEESLAGRTQALKTELSALWIELIDSDTIKSLVDSVKEMVISLEDSATGLKPVVDLLAQLLKIVSKIISVIPAGGLIASIIGLGKVGKAATSALSALFTVMSSGVPIGGKIIAMLIRLTTALNGTKIAAALAGNWVGIAVAAFTTFATIYNKFHKTAEEIHQELVQAYEDASLAVSNTEQEISNLTNKLEEQQQIINNLSDKKLSYYDSEQLQKAKMMTSEIESQLNMAKKRYEYEMSLKANAAVPLWNEKYIWNRDELIQKYIDVAPQAMKNAYSNDFIEEYITEHFDIANEWLKDIPDIIKAVNGLINWEDIDTGKAASEISVLDDYLEEYKKYYKLISEDGSDELFAAEYTNIQEIRNAAKQLLFKEDWDAELFSGIIYSDDKQIQDELNKLEEAVNKWKERYPWHTEDDVYIFDLINKLINSGDFEALREKVQEELFSTSKWDKSNNAYIFGKMFYKEFRDGVEEEHTRNPIDLSTWFADPSSIDSDKTWNDIIDSVESGLSSLGSVLEKHINANEVIDPLEIFKITDVNDSIFQQLGFDKFEDYLARYMSRLSEDQKKDGKAIQFALTDYILEAYQNFLKNVDNPDSIEGFKLITEQFEKWINAARGGSNAVDTIDKSYERLIQTLNDVKSGKLFEAEEISKLMVEYDALGDSIKVVGDKYSIEEDALIDLINQYITYGNEAVASQISAAEAAVESAQTIMDSYDLVYDKLQMMVEAYHSMVNGGVDENRARETMSHVFSVPLTDELIAAVDKYVKESGDLNELRAKLKKFAEGKNKYGKDSGNEIDWIANSLENLARKVEEAQTAYDHLWTIAGSPTALKTANDNLKAVNDELANQADGLHTAAEAYKKEFYSLGLSDEDIDRIQNEAWTIEEFKNDSERYDKLTKGLDFYKKWQDQLKNETDVRHKILENDIQQLQNINDLYNNTTAKLEAKLTLATRAKSAQKIYDQMRESQDAQYATAVAIAKLKGDEIEAEKLLAEWAQKTNETIAEKRQFAIDTVITKYDRVLSEFEMRQAVLEHGTNMLESKGYMANENYYRAMINNEITAIEKLLNKRENLVSKLNQIDFEGIASKEDLDQWWDLKNEIDGTTQALYESEEAIREWQNAVDDLRYDVFNRIQDAISGVNDEAEFLINLFRNEDFFKNIKQILSGDTFATKIYQGGYSKEGLAVLGLHQVQLKTNAELAENYAKELAEVNQKLQEDPANTKLLDRRNELLEAQRSSIEAAENEKDAILDLVREGYDKQLESLEELSSKYMEVLQREKDIYDYNKNIAKQTKDIATLRKRMAALAGDNSEEAKSRMQQISVQLKEAEDNLTDTQYDRYISDQQNLLDQMYRNLEGYFDEQMEDRDSRLVEIERLVDKNFSEIINVLTGTAGEAGTSITNTMKNMWAKPMSNISSIQENISSSDTNIRAIKNSTTDVDDYLKNYVNSYDLKIKNVLKDDDTKIAKISETIDTLNNTFSYGNHLYTVLSEQTNRDEARNQLINQLMDSIGDLEDSINIPTIDALEDMVVRAIERTQKTSGTASGLDTTTAGGKAYEGGAAAGTSLLVPNPSGNGGVAYYGANSLDISSNDFYRNGKYGNYTTKSTEEIKALYNVLTTKYDANKLLKDDPKYGEFKDDEEHYKYIYQWLKRNNYATGVRRLHHNEYAWTQEKGLEAIIRPSDGAILTPLAKNDSVLNAGATQNIWDMANNPVKFIRDSLSFPINLPMGASGGSYNIQQSMALTLPNVHNYTEFVTALQNDKKFERMLQDMTINQLTNKNTLAKYKYKYN